MPPIAKLIWAVLLGFLVYLFYLKIKGKMTYKDVNMDIDNDWYEKSQSMYLEENKKRAYYFHYDKNFIAQGHVLEDINHEIVYEAKFLYNNVISADEVDFINHIIKYKHHHKVGHTVTSSISGTTTKSSFKFDGIDVYEYMENLGYSYQFNIEGLAYTIDIIKDGKYVSKIYSSNNGKNLYESDGQIKAKISGTGFVVFETDYSNLDATFLYAMIFARTELSLRNLKHAK